MKIEARYLREKEMREAGAVFPDKEPMLKPEEKDGDVRFRVLPDERNRVVRNRSKP